MEKLDANKLVSSDLAKVCEVTGDFEDLKGATVSVEYDGNWHWITIRIMFEKGLDVSLRADNRESLIELQAELARLYKERKSEVL